MTLESGRQGAMQKEDKTKEKEEAWWWRHIGVCSHISQ